MKTDRSKKEGDNLKGIEVHSVQFHSFVTAVKVSNKQSF